MNDKKPTKPRRDSWEALGRGVDRYLKERGLDTIPAMRPRHLGWGFVRRKLTG